MGNTSTHILAAVVVHVLQNLAVSHLILVYILLTAKYKLLSLRLFQKIKW